MVGVKKIIVHKNDIVETIQRLLSEGKYNSVKVFFPGSKRHDREKIHPEYVLIIAYRSR